MRFALPVLVMVIVMLYGCVKKDKPTDNALIAQDLCESLERYSMSVYRPNLNYDQEKAAYLASINSVMSEAEFFGKTREFLIKFKDPHIWLISPSQNMYTLQELNYSRNINLNTIKHNYLTHIIDHTESIASATVGDSLGYIYLADFKGDNDVNTDVFNSIIDSFEDMKGLIIDLRENDGGSAYNAQSLLSRLVSQTTLWLTTQNRTESGFDKKFEWYINPTGAFQFNDNIVVLIGRYTVSAGERFAIAAKILPHMTLIGDTTANTQGSVMGRELLNGWKYAFTFEQCLSPDGTNYEGVGIAPDIYYDSETIDLSNSDVILERAINQFQ